VLFDLGVSSPQLADPGRGFSFRHDGPLDMRMDPEAGDSAADWLGAASEGKLVEVLRRLGEEPRAKRIARAIVERRAHAPILRTRELADLVARVAGGAGGGRAGRTLHTATATFRALRMEVNQELLQLERGLEQAARVLSRGGRIVVISFHSLEDRMVKRFIREHGRGPPVPRALPVEAARLAPPAFRSTGRAIRPGREEVERNPRARSACMRGGIRQ
jgi:16S rRNA (cytosine1402-N4)-methyltransferase